MSKFAVKTVGLRKAMHLVTLGACLCMLYIPVSASPIFIAFLNDLGAREVHFGLISGIPMIMFVLQFAAALMNNRIRRRKLPFMVSLILSRLLYLPIAFLPYLFPNMSTAGWMNMILLFIALSAALKNMGEPLWFAWMADLVPRRILGSYWGNRQRWMFMTWTLGFIATALYTYLVKCPVRTSFPVLAVICVFFGVLDIMLFLKIPEPENSKTDKVSALEALLEPFRHREYRTFVVWSVIKAFAIMMAAPFMQVYALNGLGMPVWQATVAWCILGVSMAYFSKVWGRMADKHGHRPVLILAMCGKSIVTLLFMLVMPEWAFLCLSVWFLFDGVLNAALFVGTDGYMLRIAPQKNRAMFIATIIGLSGISGGLGAILGGNILDVLSESRWMAFGREWNHFQLIFAISFVGRLACIPLTFAIKEAKSSHTMRVLEEISDMSSLAFLRLPVGLYRKMQKK